MGAVRNSAVGLFVRTMPSAVRRKKGWFLDRGLLKSSKTQYHCRLFQGSMTALVSRSIETVSKRIHLDVPVVWIIRQRETYTQEDALTIFSTPWFLSSIKPGSKFRRGINDSKSLHSISSDGPWKA